MSIIHDALKKVQQGIFAAKTNETPNTDIPTPPPPVSPFSGPTEAATPNNELPTIEHIEPAHKKPPSVLAIICAIAITLGAFVFFFKQLNSYFPQAQRMIKSSFYKLLHKKEVPAFKTKPVEDLKPLAQITINPAPAGSSLTKSPPPVTLKIHGIMSNGTGNVALINDQVYQEGDEVDGTKILKINLDSITVSNNGTEQTISVRN